MPAIVTFGWGKTSRGQLWTLGQDAIPEEVLTTEESTVAGETLVGERTATVGALDAAGVPDAVEHVEQEPVEDRAVAAGAHQQHPGAGTSRCPLRGGGGGAGVDDGRHGRVADAAVRLHSTTDGCSPRTLLLGTHRTVKIPRSS